MTKVQANSLLGGELLIEQLASESSITGKVGEAELQGEHTVSRPNIEGLSIPKEQALLASATMIVPSSW